MTTRVVSLAAAAAPGSTVTVAGRAYLHLLPQVSGRPLAARVTREPPCRLCEAPLLWRPGGWTCSDCRDTPSTDTLAAWAAEHVADGSRAGKARRDAERRYRRTTAGAPNSSSRPASCPPLPTSTPLPTPATGSAPNWSHASSCRTLIATAAERAAWRERRDSARHGAARRA